MFGLSAEEKFRKQFLSALSSFLVLYPGRLVAAHKAFPGLKTHELNPDWRPAKHALLITREFLTRHIDTSMSPEEREKVGRQLDSLSWKDMRNWTLLSLTKKKPPAFPGLHPATAFIAAAEVMSDVYFLGNQYDQADRDEFARQINQALVGMTKEERDQDRIERAINLLGEDDDDDE